MNLLEGLEKFGLQAKSVGSLFEEEKKVVTKESVAEAVEEIPTEDAFLLDKSVRCVVCDKVFKAKLVKSGRIRRLESDADLRPRFQYIDTIKYDVCSCPNCGYTSMVRYFDHLSSAQIKLIKEQICANFTPSGKQEPDTYDYDTAIGRYKLALYTTMVKRGKASEKAYTCLKIAWLYRGKIEWLIREANNEDILQLTANIEFCKKEELKFYSRAYDGLIEARATESFPICGMDTNTYELLIAAIAYNLDRLDEASNLVTGILQSRTSNKGIKNRALDLKEMIMTRMKNIK